MAVEYKQELSPLMASAMDIRKSPLGAKNCGPQLANGCPSDSIQPRCLLGTCLDTGLLLSAVGGLQVR